MTNFPRRPIRPIATPPSRSLAPVPRESTVDLIADRLRRAILDGTLPVGAPLGEAELSEQLGVSRGPVREAAQRLVQERLLTTTRRRGLAVASMAHDDVIDVYRARSAVEQAACRLLLHDGDRARTVRALTKIHQRMVRATTRRDARSAGDADLEFHQTLVDAAGSPRLSRQMSTLLIETRLCSYSLDQTFRVSADLPDRHAALIEAVRTGDETHCCPPSTTTWPTPPNGSPGRRPASAPSPDRPAAHPARSTRSTRSTCHPTDSTGADTSRAPLRLAGRR